MLRFLPAPRAPLSLLALLVAASCKSGDKLGPVPGCAVSDAKAGTINLAANQGTVVALDGAKTCVAALGTQGRYLVVPQFASVHDDPSRTDFLIGPGDVAAATSTPASGSVARAGLAAGAAGGATRMPIQREFDRRLRRLESEAVPRMLEERRQALSSGRGSLMLSRASAAAAQQPALSRSFKVLGDLDGKTTKTSNATLKYNGTRVLLYVDVNTPSGFTDNQLQQYGKLFDETLFPLAEATFGSPSDIDGNGRVLVLMTPLINALTPSNKCGEGIVTGYFYGVDLLRTLGNSNQAEVYYSMVPDPAGQFSCAQPIGVVNRFVPTTFIHELQHMISFGQHVISRGGSDEETWLNEGLSHIAEEVAANYYASRGRPDSVPNYIRGNLDNARAYLQNITGYSVTTYTDFGALEERGASWLFLRWLADLKDPDERGTSIFRQLVQTNRTGVENVKAVAGEEFGPLFGAFGIALYTDSLPGVPRTAVPERFRFKTRNLRREIVPFPLFLDPIQETLSGSMVQGTMKHYQLITEAGATTPLRFSRSNQRALAGNLAPQVGIFRLQ